MQTNLIKKYFSEELKKLDKKIENNRNLPLSVIQYDASDVFSSIQTLLSGWPTIGSKVKEVESKIKKKLNIKNAIMVNSGGSANFLMLYVLTSPYAKSGDRIDYGSEVITPAVTWSTTVGPIIQNNLVPVFIDVNLGSYDINVDLIEKNITKKTRAIMLVQPLGQSCNMDKIINICKKYNLVLIEDNCESIGAKYKNKSTGTFGKFASISMYQSHHISSVEGGFVLTNDDYYADIFRSMRANGWLREIINKKTKKKFINENKNINQSFLFPYIGNNFKPTDFSAALVSKQIDKLKNFINKRNKSANYLINKLKKYNDHLILPKTLKNNFHSWFTFAIVVKKNKFFKKIELEKFLNKSNIDTRPIIAGNIARQPFLKKFKYSKGKLVNSDLVMNNGFFIGLHHKLTNKNLNYIVSAFDIFFKKYKK